MGILAREPLEIADATQGLAGEPEAGEARWLEATVAGLRLASVYVPNGRAVGSEAFEQKLAFLDAAARRATVRDQPLLIAGDMNVCPTTATSMTPMPSRAPRT